MINEAEKKEKCCHEQAYITLCLFFFFGPLFFLCGSLIIISIKNQRNLTATAVFNEAANNSYTKI